MRSIFKRDNDNRIVGTLLYNAVRRLNVEQKVFLCFVALVAKAFRVYTHSGEVESTEYINFFLLIFAGLLALKIFFYEMCVVLIVFLSYSCHSYFIISLLFVSA